MGLHQRTTREEQVQPGGAPPRLTFTRGADGQLRVDEPEQELRTAAEAAERTVTPDDPRTGPMRDVPPVGPA